MLFIVGVLLLAILIIAFVLLDQWLKPGLKRKSNKQVKNISRHS